MGKFDNKVTGISPDVSFFTGEIATTDSTHDGLLRAQSWPVAKAQAATLWPSSSHVSRVRYRR